MTAGSNAQLELWRQKRQSLLDRLRSNPDWMGYSKAQSNLADEAVQAVYDELFRRPNLPAIAIIATGGYGRRELAPYSDVDLTVLPSDEAAPGLDGAVKELFRQLHSVIGEGLRLEIGYAYRLVNDAPGLDEKSRTAILDARLVAGSEEAFRALNELFWSSFPVAEFLLSKIEERKSNFFKTNDTPLVVEPHLKEGAGGLRSYQAANWIRRAMADNALPDAPAYKEMLHVRELLHLVACRRQDMLSRQRQAEIADLIGADVYGLGSDVAEWGLALQEEYEKAVGRIIRAHFSIATGISADAGQLFFDQTTPVGTAALAVANASKLGLTAPAGAILEKGEVDGPEALSAVAAGAEALRSLDSCGLLSELLPELTRCRTLMPRDTAHAFTVFEHTLRAVRNLELLDAGTFLGQLREHLSDLRPLFLAVILHDLGKADDSLPHSDSGELMARQVCDRWRLGSTVRDLVCWLVREHLAMARFIRLRDISLPQTIEDFAGLVRDPERLDMLTLLTYADIHAVSADSWTPNQASLLIELHSRTTAFLEGEQSPKDQSAYRVRLLRELRAEEIPDSEAASFLDRMPAHYLASALPSLVKLHLRYEQLARGGTPVVEFYDNPSLRTTELTVCCRDRLALLSAILGVIYAFDLSIHDIRACTTTSPAPIALDVFSVSFAGRPLPAATASHFKSALEEVLAGERGYEEVMIEKGKDPNGLQEHYAYTFLEGSPSILEVQAPRGRGMAYRFSRLLSRQGWNISAARVGQWAGRGSAAFYLSREDGRPISKGDVAEALETGSSP